jgi:hypothetical protein
MPHTGNNGHPQVTRRYQVLMMFFAVLISAGLVGGGLALYDRFQTTNDRRELQMTLNERFEDSTKSNCIEIELLKQGFREEAIQRYKELNNTLRLLQLERTEEIVRAAQQNRDRALLRYKKLPCPHEPRVQG